MASKGRNIGKSTGHGRDDTRYAADARELHVVLTEFSPDELREIPLVSAGTPLTEGATYVSLNDPGRNPFAAHKGVRAESGDYLVPKAEVSDSVWSKLIAVDKPERLHRSG